MSSIHPFIHSFLSLPYDGSTASSKASSPPCAIQYFHFQFPVSFRFLKMIQWLLTSSSSSSRNFYPSFYLSFNSVVQKAVPTQDVTNTASLPAFYFMHRQSTRFETNRRYLGFKHSGMLPFIDW
jgi:hypothetical protein